MITVRRGDRGYVGQGSESMMGRCVIASLVVRVVAHFAGFFASDVGYSGVCQHLLRRSKMG